MGSKAKIINFVTDSILSIYNGGIVGQKISNLIKVVGFVQPNALLTSLRRVRVHQLVRPRQHVTIHGFLRQKHLLILLVPFYAFHRHTHDLHQA
jgi:hypothetical protein